MGGPRSKLSRQLGHVTEQLKSGKTRGANPRDLSSEEIDALKQKEAALRTKMREARAERIIGSINDHTTEQVKLHADRVIESQQKPNEQINDMAQVILTGHVPPRPEGQTVVERLSEISKSKPKLKQKKKNSK